MKGVNMAYRKLTVGRKRKSQGCKDVGCKEKGCYDETAERLLDGKPYVVWVIKCKTLTKISNQAIGKINRIL